MIEWNCNYFCSFCFLLWFSKKRGRRSGKMVKDSVAAGSSDRYTILLYSLHFIHNAFLRTIIEWNTASPCHRMKPNKYYLVSINCFSKDVVGEHEAEPPADGSLAPAPTTRFVAVFTLSVMDHLLVARNWFTHVPMWFLLLHFYLGRKRWKFEHSRPLI